MNYEDPNNLPTSELILALARWGHPSSHHEPEMKKWLEACVTELDERVPSPETARRCSKCCVCR